MRRQGKDRPAGKGRGAIRQAADESGQALTEFAFVLPLLLLLVLAMVDFGKAINYWIDETHLSNEAARFAAVNNNPGAGAGKTLQQYILSQTETPEQRGCLPGGSKGTQRSSHCTAVNICFYNSSGTLYTSPASANVGDTVEVIVRYAYDWLRGFPFPGNPTTTITGKAAMRLESLPTNYDPANNLGALPCPTTA